MKCTVTWPLLSGIQDIASQGAPSASVLSHRWWYCSQFSATCIHVLYHPEQHVVHQARALPVFADSAALLKLHCMLVAAWKVPLRHEQVCCNIAVHARYVITPTCRCGACIAPAAYSWPCLPDTYYRQFADFLERNIGWCCRYSSLMCSMRTDDISADGAVANKLQVGTAEPQAAMPNSADSTPAMETEGNHTTFHQRLGA